MKLKIDIDEAEYKTLSKMSEKEKVNELSYYERAIANGIPYEERPQGKWKNVGFMVCECDNCKEQFHELEANNYCPNCGADMRGAE